jgi:hypothetical protein
VNACFEHDGPSGYVPEAVFGDDRQLAEDIAARDAILKRNATAGGFSEDYPMDNRGFRPG